MKAQEFYATESHTVAVSVDSKDQQLEPALSKDNQQIRVTS